MNRHPARAIPHDCSFALICDADRGDVMRCEMRFGDCVAHAVEQRGPDFLRVMLDESWLRKVLREFALRRCDRNCVLIKDNRADTCGAAIE